MAGHDISFDFKEVEIFCLLGPNDAGSTTTSSVLPTLFTPTSEDTFISEYSVNQN